MLTTMASYGMVNCKQAGKSAANEEQIELVQTAITLHMQQAERTRSRVATAVFANHIKASKVVNLCTADTWCYLNRYLQSYLQIK